ncbi:MAG: outer membrane lipoprotein carrier protein LolA, partial [bacterium]
DRINTLQSDFVQTAVNKMFGRKATSRGRLSIKRPSLMRWNYYEPEKQLFIVDSRKFWWFTPLNRQVVIKPLKKVFGSNLPLAFIMGNKKIADEFKVSFLRAMINLSKLEIKVRRGTFRIFELDMYDAYHNKTSVALSNYRENIELPEEMFHFTAPEGVRVITPEDIPF